MSERNQCTTSLKGALNQYIGDLAGYDDTAALAMRVNQVQNLWEKAVRGAYGPSAPLVLQHTNGVYIMQEEGKTVLAVYLDDSLVRGDVKVNQERLKMTFAFAGEQIDVFKVYPSKFGMRERHPYQKKDEETASPVKLQPLTPEIEAAAEKLAQPVEDPVVRNALIRAIRADFQLNGKN